MKASQISALERMQKQLLSGVKPEKQNGQTFKNLVPMTSSDKERLSNEIAILQDRINGIKHKKVTAKTVEVAKNQKRYVIECYSVRYGFVKKADKRATKGKSKSTKMKSKRVKTLTLVKSVDCHSKDLLSRYKDGLMGMSPKLHVFKLKEVGM